VPLVYLIGLSVFLHPAGTSEIKKINSVTSAIPAYPVLFIVIKFMESISTNILIKK
jgi:hypothetical protein